MLFQNKYRIESARLKDWDYSNSAWYYITICTKKMRNFFGEATAEKVELAIAGKIVDEEWKHTIEIRKNVELDEFVIMPNHFHGILIINNVEKLTVETNGHSSLPLIKQNISNIIKGFKSITTTRIRKEITKEFAWQPRFYDHIIRNEKSLHAIRKYIMLNPLKWEIDEYYKK